LLAKDADRVCFWIFITSIGRDEVF
jgi:hypothetical protein